MTKNEQTKAHRQRPVGACDAVLTDAESGASYPCLLGRLR